MLGQFSPKHLFNHFFFFFFFFGAQKPLWTLFNQELENLQVLQMSKPTVNADSGRPGGRPPKKTIIVPLTPTEQVAAQICII